MNDKSGLIAVGVVVMTITVLAGLQWNRQTVPISDEVPGTIAIAGASLLVAILLGARAQCSAGMVSLIVGSTLAFGVLLDAFIHFIMPPETGNLFPMAMVALGVLGAIIGFLGGLIGRGIARLLNLGGPGSGT